MALPSILPFRRNQDLAPASDPFVTLRREMDRLFDDAFRGFGFGSPAFGSTQGMAWAPSVDVRETDNGLEVHAELPGVDEKDIELTVTDGILTIRGEKKVDRDDKGEGWRLVERSRGTFVRSIALPMDVDQEKARAEFKNGVLRIALPASPEAEKKVHRIKVKG
jgi:HSP20 family protein